MLKRKILTLILVLLASRSFGSELTLDEYIAVAIEENSGVKSAFENWQSSLSKVAYSNSLPDPKITYGHFIKSVETRVGPQRFRLGFAQMIPWVGKLSARKDVASKQAFLAEAELEFSYVELRRGLTEAFLELLFLQKAISLQKDYIDLAEALEQTAQSQSRVGGSKADVIQSQMELNRLEYELATLEEKLVTAKAKVGAFLNVSDPSRITLPSDIEEYADYRADALVELTEEELLDVNPELQILGALRGVQDARKGLSRQDRYPDITVGVDWVKTDRALMATPDSGKDPIMAFVSLNVPLWVGKNRSKEQEATRRLDQVGALQQQKKFDVWKEQKQVLYSFSDARKRVKLFRDRLLPEAEEALSILTEAYKTGRADFERLQNSEMTLLQMQLKLERARSDLGIAVAKYQAMTGGATK